MRVVESTVGSTIRTPFSNNTIKILTALKLKKYTLERLYDHDYIWEIITRVRKEVCPTNRTKEQRCPLCRGKVQSWGRDVYFWRGQRRIYLYLGEGKTMKREYRVLAKSLVVTGWFHNAHKAQRYTTLSPA